MCFTRRSGSLQRPAFIQDGKWQGLYYNRSSGRVYILSLWKNVHGGESVKHVTLANVVRSDKAFPQTLQKFLKKISHPRLRFSQRMFGGFAIEYLRVKIWGKLGLRIDEDVLNAYVGWYTGD